MWFSSQAAPRSSRDDILTSGRKLYSQFDEELIIRHFFNDRREGFFLDVGAYHWRDNSTTYYLEKHLAWSGIAVDALDQFRSGYLEHRPGTRFLNYIVTDHSGTMDPLYVAGPLTSVRKDHVAHVVAALEEQGRLPHPSEPDPQAEELELPEVRVPAITLNDLLDQNDVEEIDFLSMDIEEGEPAALAGFDIERFRPELVCIEVTDSVRDEIEAYFEAHAYERILRYAQYDAVNWYYQPKGGADPE